MITKKEIIELLVSNSLTWNKEENQDRAFIYVDDFVEDLYLKLLNVKKISDCFSFADYLNQNFEYVDNTDYGDVYSHKHGHGLYSEKEIFDKWLNDK